MSAFARSAGLRARGKGHFDSGSGSGPRRNWDKGREGTTNDTLANDVSQGVVVVDRVGGRLAREW